MIEFTVGQLRNILGYIQMSRVRMMSNILVYRDLSSCEDYIHSKSTVLTRVKNQSSEQSNDCETKYIVFRQLKI